MSGEDLNRADFAQIAPVAAVRGCDHCGVVVAYVLAAEKAGAIGQNDVVRSETFLGDRRRRDDEDKAGAETERQDWTVL